MPRKTSQPQSNSSRLTCSRCGRDVELGRGECYLIDIRAVADPSPPVFTGEDLSRDAAREIDRLLKQLRKLTARELAAQVYSRKLFCLCNACHARWIQDPFGADHGFPST
jgi:hypothetical protein